MLDLDSIIVTNDRTTAKRLMADCKNELVAAVNKRSWQDAMRLASQIGRYEQFLAGTLKRFPGKDASTLRHTRKAKRADATLKSMRRKYSVPSWTN